MQNDKQYEVRPEEVSALYEVLEYAVFLVDRRGLIASWNKGAARVMGYSDVEVLGNSHRILYSAEDIERKLPEHHLSEATKMYSLRHEGWRLRKDGTRFWGSTSITALHDNTNQHIGFINIVSDLTSRKAAEEETTINAEQLRESNEALRKSEEKYHKMIAEIPDYAIILLDKDGTILDWNRGAETIKLYKANEIVGRNFRTFYSNEDREGRLPEKLLRIASKEGSVHHEGWRIRKDGTRFWGAVSISALHNQEGEIIGFSKVTRDLTEQKRAEDRLAASAEVLRQANEALKASEEQYHRMISEVKDYAIILLDKEGKIQNWNAGAEQIKQYTAKDAIGKNFRIFYSPEDRHAGLPERLLEEAITHGRAVHEGWRVKKDGSKFWGSVVITALHGSTGNLLGFSKVTRDLTARKKADDELRDNALQLDRKNRMLMRLNDELESFNYVASHDLKEPLRKIQTFVNLIERSGDVPAGSASYLARIKHSAGRSYQLIEDLLSLSRVSNDRSRFQMVDLNDVFVRVRDELELTIREKNARVISEQLPVISGVGFQLEQLFTNLISNSLKFSMGDPTVRIRYIVGDFVTPDNDLVTCHQISVVDNGMGFDQQYASLIFGAFQRLDSASASGTGIGLAIVKKVMENHGGWVSAEGRPNEGATFNLYFPAVAQVSGSIANEPELARHNGSTDGQL